MPATKGSQRSKSQRRARLSVTRSEPGSAPRTENDGRATGVQRSAGGHRLDARPDTLDFRDRMYEASLIEVPPHRRLEKYGEARVPILDQGTEGACTGFGLATVVNYLLRVPAILSAAKVSPRMLYEMAKRYTRILGQKGGAAGPEVTRHQDSARVVEGKLCGIASASNLRLAKS